MAKLHHPERATTDELVTLSDVAAALGMSRQGVHRWAQQDSFPYPAWRPNAPTGAFLYWKGEVQDWVNSR